MDERFHLEVSNQSGLNFIRREIEISASLITADKRITVNAIVPEEFANQPDLIVDLTQALLRVAKERAAKG